MEKRSEIQFIFYAYINRTLWNKANEYYRRKSKYYKELYQDEENISEPTTDLIIDSEQIEDYVENDEIHERLAKLTEKERSLLYQKYVLLEKDIEIAKQLGITNQAVGQFKKRILAKLRKELV